MDVAILAAQAVLLFLSNKTWKSSSSSQVVFLKRSYLRAALACPLLRIAVNTVSPRTKMEASESSTLGGLLEEVKRA
jgi:hypothetical protein